MKRLAAFVMAGLAACASTSSNPEPMTFPEAQAIVDQVAANHENLVRLTLHAVPTGGDRCRVVASNVAEKLDDWSDPEDLQAMETGQPVVLMEGANLDYTAPVFDAAGKTIAVVGVTVSGESEAGMLEAAKQIASETSSAIFRASGKLW